MGKLYNRYLDEKRIRQDRLREECREKGMVPCSRCGRPAFPRGVSYIGPPVCPSCRESQFVSGSGERSLLIKHNRQEFVSLEIWVRVEGPVASPETDTTP
jgi:hypothetical protein